MMDHSWRDSSILDIHEKVLAGERLSKEDGIRLYHSDDLLQIGYMANILRSRMHGKNAYFVCNRHINPTNICVNRCRICAFSRDPGDEDAYLMKIDEIIELVRRDLAHGIREVHIVGGLHPEVGVDYYTNLIREIKNTAPHLFVKALTPVEIDHIARVSGIDPERALELLKDAGIDSLAGGGAEIFSERCRLIGWEKKISGRRWLDITRAAHRLGIRSNATMLYGHVETKEERVDHLIRLRELQDETGGFQAFIPLPFHPEGTSIGHKRCGGVDDLKTIAISRLILDNFPHIKAYWIGLGVKTAQVALSFGADDLDGTIVEERIFHAAGAESRAGMERGELISLIKEAGFVPLERDGAYRLIGSGGR